MPHDRAATDTALARVVRTQAGALTGALVRALGDFDLAEDAVQDALVLALERWPRDGIPSEPRAWLLTVARRRAIDRLRRDARYREKLAALDLGGLLREEQPPEADDRLKLVFTCCHPALARESQIALTLRAVIGLTTAEIARALLVGEATLGQRITRAKRKIVEAGIPFAVPSGDERGARLREVLTVLYLTFNEGYLSRGSGAASRPDLAGDAEWLASLVASLLPREPEALGLLALMRLHVARGAARFGTDGGLVLLRDQDRRLWDRERIADGARLLERAATLGPPGPFWIQAAIAACHAEAPSWGATDWRQILALYDALERQAPSAVVRLNRAVALWHVAGADLALAEVEALASSLESYHLFHATRAELLRALGRDAEAREADARALDLTANPAERALLQGRLARPWETARATDGA